MKKQMLRRIVVILSTLILAALILVASLYRTSTLKYAFYDHSPKSTSNPDSYCNGEIDYYMPYPGPILPDNPLWYVKAARDRFFLMTAGNSLQKARLALLYADKRLLSSQMLFAKGKPELGYSTMVKSQKYFEQAVNLEKQSRERGDDTSDFQRTLANAALKHQQIGMEILAVAPEDARPDIIRLLDYPKEIYQVCSKNLEDKGLFAPRNPFIKG